MELCNNLHSFFFFLGGGGLPLLLRNDCAVRRRFYISRTLDSDHLHTEHRFKKLSSV